MRAVWYFFKLIEAILGLSCLAIHIKGFLNQDLEQNSILLCLIFGGFSTHAMFGHLSMCLGLDPSPLAEAWAAAAATICYLSAALLSMYHAEKDFYFMYLSDFEEPLHPFFKYSKAQGIGTLAATLMYMLHACLAFDVSLEEEDEGSGEDSDVSEEKPKTKLELVLFGTYIYNLMLRMEWFHRFTTSKY